MKRERIKDRLERCLRFVEEHPDRASAYFNLGLAYTQARRVTQAEQAYRKAVELDPKLALAWVNLGGLRLMQWDFEGALKANQAAAEIDDELVLAHYNMGQAYLYLNDPENLLRCAKRVIELERDHASGHYYAAVAALALGNLGMAERHLGRAMELGHRPPQDFLKAMDKARVDKARAAGTLVEITGAEAPDNPKED